MMERAIVLASVFVFAGCGSGAGCVSGKVTYLGQPLASGSVTLIAADGQRFDSALTAAGEFTFDRVPLGRAKIAVHSHPRVPPILLGKDRNTPAGKEAARFVPIPERYGSLDDSGLFIDVCGGQQTCRLELTGP